MLFLRQTADNRVVMMEWEGAGLEAGERAMAGFLGSGLGREQAPAAVG